MEKKKERIAKFIAACGVCSRRGAEDLIAKGAVCVDGEVLTTPVFLVDGTEKITVNGQDIVLPDMVRLWCYHKPRGVLTTQKDPAGRPTVFETLPKHLPRVMSVGRLDFNSEGLLLLTTGGALKRYLELPSTGWTRTYRVRVHGKITPEIIGRLQKGIKIDGVAYAPCQIMVEKEQGTNVWLQMSLTEGKNREIRRMLGFFDLPVSRLIRISYGPFQLGKLQVGQVKEVPQKQVKEILNACHCGNV